MLSQNQKNVVRHLMSRTNFTLKEAAGVVYSPSHKKHSLCDYRNCGEQADLITEEFQVCNYHRHLLKDKRYRLT